MTERAQLKHSERCSVPTEIEDRFLELFPGVLISRPIEVCKGDNCGAERELGPDKVKWLWHKPECEDPGRLKLEFAAKINLRDHKEFGLPPNDPNNQIEKAHIQCLGCEERTVIIRGNESAMKQWHGKIK